MRHTRVLGAAAVIAASAMLLTGCGAAAGSGAGTGGDDKTVALLIPGTLGDGGFFDQSNQGVKAGAKKVGWTADVVEAGYEPTKWQPALEALANGTDNPIITGSFAMTDLVEQAAAGHPDKDFVLFDSAIDESKCGGCKNVYSIVYRYDETGFLAGVLAGLLELTSGVDKIKQTGVVGVVGGQDIPVIEDYIRGFEVGVKVVAPKVKVLSAFVGSFSDPVQGKAVAEDMIGQGAEILFSAAGGSDKGVFEGAAAHDVWAIGNAAAQANDPKVDGVNTILTSSDTNVAHSIEKAVEMAHGGTLPLGKVKSFGVKDGTNSITLSEVYKSVVPAEIQQKVKDFTAKLADGAYESQLKKK